MANAPHFQEQLGVESEKPDTSRAPSQDGNAGPEGQSSRDSASLVDHGDEKPKGKIAKWKPIVIAHYKKYWYWHLLGLVIFLAILLPIVFKVIVPAIVQNVVNGQALPVHGGAIQATSADTVSLELNSTLTTPLGIKIDPFQLQLYNADTPDFSPFLDLEVGTLHIKRPRSDITIAKRDYTIANQSELTLWFDQIFNRETVPISVVAAPTVGVHLGILYSTNSLRKTVEIPGLNGLHGSQISNLEFLFPPVDGHNIRGQLTLPNAGVIDLGLGNTSFNLMSADIKIGQVWLDNLTLYRQRNNTPDFYGDLYLNTIFTQNLPAFLDAQANPLGAGYIELNATGNSTIANGQNVKYLENVLNNNYITFRIPILTFLSDFLNGLLQSRNGSSIVDVLSDVLGNRTLIQGAIDNFNTSTAGNQFLSDMKKRHKRETKVDIRGLLAKNMLRWGLKTPKRSSLQPIHNLEL